MKLVKISIVAFLIILTVFQANAVGKHKKSVRGEVYEWFTANPAVRTEIYINREPPGTRKLIPLSNATIHLIHADNYQKIDSTASDYLNITTQSDSLGFFEFKPQNLHNDWVMLLTVSKNGYIGWGEKFKISSDTTNYDVYIHTISRTFHKPK